MRRLRAADGREVIQVRIPLGIEQYEIDGRPDGRRPEDRESWLEYYSERISPGSVSPEDRSLSEQDFVRLHEEGLLYYHRYLLFFQIQEYALCARDTRRNLKLLRFVGKFAPPEISEQLEQYRPYILRMYFMSRALLRIQQRGNARFAVRLLRKGRELIDALEPIPGNQIFEWEKTRALTSLDDLISQLEAQMPQSRGDKLRRQLEAAVREENYEKAAVLRDEIAKLERARYRRKSRRLEPG